MPYNAKHTHFLPSPFPTVTQYEDRFIREWNANNAAALGDVLKYIADATAVAVKELKEDGTKEDNLGRVGSKG